ncbi:hypothetical protein RFI_39754 [Reticulomyxa filosa]|uniref:Uncharacterized protein n=1 Tax=Reticulomyxa filosa TaxID=46433 RepID=X6L9G0_RETFI|nr:hypothetical protein RFI_39754 [Reticulomyxa filosa]|eukprot:ETN97771.1 hypothetical protein RFI_39754 [Reticulomyxa filosa]
MNKPFLDETSLDLFESFLRQEYPAEKTNIECIDRIIESEEGEAKSAKDDGGEDEEEKKKEKSKVKKEGLESGEIVEIIGNNQSGKSSLLYTITAHMILPKWIDFNDEKIELRRGHNRSVIWIDGNHSFDTNRLVEICKGIVRNEITRHYNEMSVSASANAHETKEESSKDETTTTAPKKKRGLEKQLGLYFTTSQWDGVIENILKYHIYLISIQRHQPIEAILPQLREFCEKLRKQERLLSSSYKLSTDVGANQAHNANYLRFIMVDDLNLFDSFTNEGDSFWKRTTSSSSSSYSRYMFAKKHSFMEVLYESILKKHQLIMIATRKVFYKNEQEVLKHLCTKPTSSIKVTENNHPWFLNDSKSAYAVEKRHITYRVLLWSNQSSLDVCDHMLYHPSTFCNNGLLQLHLFFQPNFTPESSASNANANTGNNSNTRSIAFDDLFQQLPKHGVSAKSVTPYQYISANAPSLLGIDSNDSTKKWDHWAHLLAELDSTAKFRHQFIGYLDRVYANNTQIMIIKGLTVTTKPNPVNQKIKQFRFDAITSTSGFHVLARTQ